MREYAANHQARTQSPALLRSLAYCVGLIAVGWLIGSIAARPTTASAQVTNAAPDQHFLAGDQLSLPLLQDISTTLHQMDARLARLEATADRLSMDTATRTKRKAASSPDAP
jgi:hypothetical protein